MPANMWMPKHIKWLSNSNDVLNKKLMCNAGLSYKVGTHTHTQGNPYNFYKWLGIKKRIPDTKLLHLISNKNKLYVWTLFTCS